MNCTHFATYEDEGSSVTAALCHGGVYQGTEYAPCRARGECRLAMVRTNRSGPVAGIQTLASSPQNLRSQPVASSVASPPARNTSWQPSSHLAATRPMTPTAQALHERVTGAVSYVVPKDDVPLAMRTPYVAPTGIQPGGEMTPTFLPREGESLIGRFGKNAAQGALGSIGWQLYNLARSVDFFAPTKSPPQAART